MRCGKIMHSQADHRKQHGAYAQHAAWLRLQTHTHTEYVTYLFSTTTVVIWTRLDVPLYVHCRLVGVYLQLTYKPKGLSLLCRHILYSPGDMGHAVVIRRRWICWWFQITTLRHSDTICWTSIYGQLQVAWFENKTHYKSNFHCTSDRELTVLHIIRFKYY
jgi:hypothetical protein